MHKILQCWYYWHTILQDAHDFSKSCDHCKQDRGISRRQDLVINQILVIVLFYVWGIDFIGMFLSSHGIKYILVAVDYVSKWVEETALPNNKGKSVTSFLKKNIFSIFCITRAIIIDGGISCSKCCRKNMEFATMWPLYTTQRQAVMLVSNWEIKQNLAKTVNANRTDW